MSHDLDGHSVAARLNALRRGWVAETIEEGRQRLAAERPRPTRSFAEDVARRLDELRALDELARYLRGAVRR